MSRGKPKKAVILMTTGEVFDSITSASRKYETAITSIIMCCQGKLKSAGGVVNGKPLVWRYVEDSLDFPEYIIPVNKHKKPVILKNTGQFFQSIAEASRHYNVDQNSVRKCCEGVLKSAGKFSTGEKLVWEYSTN